MKTLKMGLLVGTLAFSMSSAFAFLGMGNSQNKVEFNNVNGNGQASMAFPRNIQPGSLVVCKTSNLKSGKITINGLDKTYNITPGMKEVRGIVLQNNGSLGYQASGVQFNHGTVGKIWCKFKHNKNMNNTGSMTTTGNGKVQ